MAEQEIIKSGVPVSDVQKLCDVHSALFHGATREERIKNADMAAHLLDNEVEDNINLDKSKYKEIIKIKGHPINTLREENKIIAIKLENIEKVLDENKSKEEIVPLIEELRQTNTHYAKKGDLIYPVLNVNYEFSGPSNVMWGVDNEIRDELRILATSKYTFDSFKPRLEKVVNRAKEMIYKEENILFPLILDKFSKDDLMRMYIEFNNYEKIGGVNYKTWEEADLSRDKLKFNSRTIDKSSVEGNQVNMDDDNKNIDLGKGSLNRVEIEAVLNTIPMELTFVDANNINKYFNDGGKLFKRPETALGREVFTCHPPKAQEVVKRVIEDLRDGNKNSVDVWMSKGDNEVLIRYMAVRDKEGKFLGTLECVQEMGEIKEHYKNK